MCFTHALIILSKLLRTTSSESTEQEPGFSCKLKSVSRSDHKLR